MRIAYHRIGHTDASVLHFDRDELRIGSAEGNHLVLEAPSVAPLAAIVARRDQDWELTALGQNPISIGPHRIEQGERILLGPRQLLEIFPFRLEVDLMASALAAPQQDRAALDQQLSRTILEVHRELLGRIDMAGGDEGLQPSDDFVLNLERDLEEIAGQRGFLERRSAELLNHCAACTLLAHLSSAMIEADSADDVWHTGGRWTQNYTAVAGFEDELENLAGSVRRRLGLDAIDDITRKIEALEQGFWRSWGELSAELHQEIKKYLGLRYLKKQIKDLVFGYGPLEDLLRLPTVTEIMVVDRSRIYVEKHGLLEKSGRRFPSDEVTVNIIERIVTRVGRRIDKSQPLVDARLTDGSRVNAVIPPVAIGGPCLTVRKFPVRRLAIDDLVECGTLTRTVAEFLRAAVVARKNILISGGTGTGKTTLLNCISNFIPDKERIVTIEDTAELQLQKEHVVRLETKAANVEGAGQYDIRDLVRNALRMRPDRVVVGECRGAEALDMLQAMNTGHDGSMTTIHANTSEDVVLRLEVLVQMNEGSQLPITSIHRQIATAIDLVVQLTRLKSGQRIVSQVTELADYDPRGGAIQMKDLFVLAGDPNQPQLVATGSLPTFMGELLEKNLVDLEAFYV